jgi:hypothetical protein
MILQLQQVSFCASFFRGEFAMTHTDLEYSCRRRQNQCAVASQKGNPAYRRPSHPFGEIRAFAI